MKEVMTLGKRILESNVKRLNFPYKLTFIVTDKCNSRCKICNIWKRKPKNELTLAEINRFFRKSNRFSWIDVSGGEIFLRNDIVDIVRIILANCKDLYLLHFPTNGLLPELIEEKTKEIMALKPKKFIVSVSLDGPPDLHNKLRGVPYSWRNSVETYKRLERMKGVEVYFGMTLSSYNAGKFKETYEAVKKAINNISYRDFHVNIAHSSEHYYGSKLKQDPKEIINEIKKFIELRGIPYSPVFFLEFSYLNLSSKFLKSKKSPLPCKALTSSCFINAQGDVFPCSLFNKKLGNLRDFDYDLRKIWGLKTTKDVLTKIKNGQCVGCWTPCEAYQAILGNLLNKSLYYGVNENKTS